MQTLVLHRDVEVAGVGRGQQFHFLTHGSDLRAGDAQFGDDTVDTVLLDGTQGVGGDLQLDPALLIFQPEPLLMQVRQEAALLLVVGVRDAVANGRALARNFTDARHGKTLEDSNPKKGVLYNSRKPAPASESAAYRRYQRSTLCQIPAHGKQSAHLQQPALGKGGATRVAHDQ